MAALGHHSHLCTTRTEGDLKSKINDDVGYFYMNKKSVIGLKGLLSLVKYIRHNHIEIIHAHSSSYFTASLVKLSNRRAQLIWHDHYGNSELLDSRPKLILKLCSNWFQHIISVNTILKKWAIQNLNAKNNTFLRNFSVLEHSVYKVTELRGEKGKRIVCLANLRPQKDHLNLLIAFKELINNHTGWTLHLVGLDLNDNYSDEIKEFISENSLSSTVYIYGSCKDVQHILSQATIGVLSSKSEGLPLALIEYGFARLPVVVTNVGECGEVVHNLKDGLVVQPSNSDYLEKAIEELIVNTEKRNVYAEAFNKKVSNEFSASVYLQKLMNIYNASLN